MAHSANRVAKKNLAKWVVPSGILIVATLIIFSSIQNLNEQTLLLAIGGGVGLALPVILIVNAIWDYRNGSVHAVNGVTPSNLEPDHERLIEEFTKDLDAL